MPNEEQMYRKNADNSFSQFIELTGRNTKTVQTHNAVSVPGSGISDPTQWMDTNGFFELNITLLNDAATSNGAHVLWSNDGISIHGITINVIASATTLQREGTVTTKARYAKVRTTNGDALAHTQSAWAYLKS